jgi:hypothetical protein
LNSFVNARRFRLAMTPLLPHFRAIWGVYQTGAGSERRAFLVGTLSLLVAPLAAEAQQIGKVYRVGVLASSTESNFGPSVRIFRQALYAAGWVEGRNLTLDVRYPGDQYARLQELANELVKLKVDVLASLGTRQRWQQRARQRRFRS